MITFAPDVSKYDATTLSGTLSPMNWVKCRDIDKIPIAIMKCSEYTIDPAFTMQWNAAKGILPRAAYHFFRPQRTDQLTTILESVNGFQENDRIMFDWEYFYPLMSAKAQRDYAYTLLCALRGEFDSNPIIYTYPYFWNYIIGGKNDARFAQFGLAQAEWPYDGPNAPIYRLMRRLSPRREYQEKVSARFSMKRTAVAYGYMDDFKRRIIAGTMKPGYTLSPWNRMPDIWQFTARCDPAYIKGYTPNAAKKAVDMNAIYIDVSH